MFRLPHVGAAPFRIRAIDVTHDDASEKNRRNRRNRRKPTLVRLPSCVRHHAEIPSSIMAFMPKLLCMDQIHDQIRPRGEDLNLNPVVSILLLFTPLDVYQITLK